MVNSFLNEKSKLDVAAIFKAEREFYETKAQFDSLDNMPGAMEKIDRLGSDVKALTEMVTKNNALMVQINAKLDQQLGNVQQSTAGQAKAGGDATGATKGAAAGNKKVEDKKPAKPAANDDDIDLFGSDEEEEDEEAKKLRGERLAAYDAKKAKKPALIAKSSIVLEVKPWDDETVVEDMEKAVRSIEMEGLLWGASKFVEIAYGIKKLQISCVVEDDKVSVDLLEEKITDFDELVQSVDIASFNKI